MIETLVDVRGAKLHLRRAGRGRPLLFLHGIEGMREWPEALERLGRRFEVLAPDHPGFGGSDAAHERIDDVGDLAFFYLDLLDELDLEGVHLVGQSLGGWIALELAIRSTARLASLTLASAAGIRVEGVPRADAFICPPAEVGRLLYSGDAAAQWFAEWQATPERQATFDRNRAAAAKYSWQPRLYNPRLARWLHRVDVPTHIIWGDQDRLIPPAHATALAARIPGSRVTLLPDAGHIAHIDAPERFAAAVAAFIDGAGA